MKEAVHHSPPSLLGRVYYIQRLDRLALMQSPEVPEFACSCGMPWCCSRCPMFEAWRESAMLAKLHGTVISHGGDFVSMEGEIGKIIDEGCRNLHIMSRATDEDVREIVDVMAAEGALS